MIVSVVLAAGEGTRMRSSTPKVLHKICGKSLLEHVLDCLRDLKSDKQVVIVGHKGDAVREYFRNRESIVFVNQPVGKEYPYGTGFAVKCAAHEFSDEDTVIILNGDAPLISKDTLSDLLEYHNKGLFSCTVLTAHIDNPKGYGRILRDDNSFLEKIVEENDATAEEKLIAEVNSGVYVFKGKDLLNSIDEISADNNKGELYLTDVIEILKGKGKKVGAFATSNEQEILGVNSKVELESVGRIMRNEINTEYMREGVVIVDAQNTYIDKGVKIGRDTVIFPGALIEGESVIGENVTIKGATHIVNSEIKDGSTIESSVIEDSVVGQNVKIGPFAHLRPNSNISDNAKIGNFVEIKNTNLGEGSKASHLTYLGDSDVGAGVNIGCGVITVNYDGKNKFRTTIEDGAFVGCNANLIAPVKVGKDAFVGAGSTITDDVGSGDLAISRVRQEIKVSWVTKKNNMEGQK